MGGSDDTCANAHQSKPLFVLYMAAAVLEMHRGRMVHAVPLFLLSLSQRSCDKKLAVTAAGLAAAAYAHEGRWLGVVGYLATCVHRYEIAGAMLALNYASLAITGEGETLDRLVAGAIATYYAASLKDTLKDTFSGHMTSGGHA